MRKRPTLAIACYTLLAAQFARAAALHVLPSGAARRCMAHHHTVPQGKLPPQASLPQPKAMDRFGDHALF